MKKLSEQEFVDEHLTGRTWPWQELIECGRAPLEDLEDGPLKTVLTQYLLSGALAQKALDALGYEAG